jgi:hypothetical protein
MRRLSAFLLALLATGVHADTTEIRSLQDLGNATQNAVLCKEPVDARDKPVLKDLLRLGVKVEGADDDGPIGLTYTLPPGVRVFGYEVKKVIYEGDSGSLFYVEIPVAPTELTLLKSKLGLVPIPSGHTEYSYFDYQEEKYYRQTQPPTKDIPYPDAIVAGLEHHGTATHIYVGCRTFDG